MKTKKKSMSGEFVTVEVTREEMVAVLFENADEPHHLRFAASLSAFGEPVSTISRLCSQIILLLNHSARDVFLGSVGLVGMKKSNEWEKKKGFHNE